ncbi:AsmA family protein [Candidatus Omnitrophota bacterium]
MKVLNFKGIIILVVLLLIVQLGVGLVISPILGSVVINNLNKAAGTKITVGKVNIWPLTLSCSLKDLKVFDPDDETQRMALIKKASLRISPLRLLSKQLVLSHVSISGAEIDLKGEPDGSFNIQKLARGEEAEKAPTKKTGIFGQLKGKKDWFSRIYGMIKDTSSTEAVAKKAADQEEARTVKRQIQELPKGRRVLFKTLSDEYVFQIRAFAIKNSKLNIETADKQGVSVEKASIIIRNLGIDPTRGARFDALSMRGDVNKEGTPAGTFNLEYNQSFKRHEQRTAVDISAKNIDLTAINFIYEDSLPVDFTKGIITIRSDTKIINDDLNSNNSIILKDHNVVPQGGQQAMVGIFPLASVCNALNQVDPLDIKFKITGTLENPQFKGFQDILLSLLKPYLTSMVTEGLEQKGKEALGGLLGGAAGADASTKEDAASEAIDSIKSFLGDLGEKK